MNLLLTSVFVSLAVVTILGQSVTENPSAIDGGKLIGHFPSSPNPVELFHITDSSKNIKHQYLPRSFTYKWTVSPHRRTFSPLKLVASRKPHSRGTNAPSKVTRNEVSFPINCFNIPFKLQLSHHGGVTFPPGAFTYKVTFPPLGKRTFAPIETKKNGPTPQTDIYSWAPIKSVPVTKKTI
ncbi:unnamed protein product [Caenorhabditis brenneri]